MKRYIILLLIQFGVFSFYAQDSIPAITTPIDTIKQVGAVIGIEQANHIYGEGKYTEAIAVYKQLLLEKGESALVYYNLGNAYYKINEIAPAILNYERALLLNPRDGDARFNLEMAKLKTVDKIEPLGKFFLVQWLISFCNICSINQWSWIGIISFLLLIGCLTLFSFSRKILWKKVGFYVGILLVVLTITSNIFAYQQKKSLTGKNVAIIFAPTVTIKGAPDKSGTEIVVVHEGTKVFIRSQLGEWSEVVLENGTIGWIENKMIEII